jgi:hypothetical protein
MRDSFRDAALAARGHERPGIAMEEADRLLGVRMTYDRVDRVGGQEDARRILAHEQTDVCDDAPAVAPRRARSRGCRRSSRRRPRRGCRAIGGGRLKIATSIGGSR